MLAAWWVIVMGHPNHTEKMALHYRPGFRLVDILGALAFVLFLILVESLTYWWGLN